MMTRNTNRNEEDEEHPQAVQPDETFLLNELRRQLPELDVLASRFYSLYQAAMSIAPQSSSQPQDLEKTDLDLDCETCENLLDLYVTDELEGHDVKSTYPLIWDHVQACYRCQRAYSTLTDFLAHERDAEKDNTSLAPLPDFTIQSLSFLEPQSAEAAWITHLKSQIDGASFSLTFQLNIAYLQTLFSPSSLVPVRTEDVVSPPTSHLLLHQNVQIGHQTLTVDVTYTQLRDKPDDLALRATLVGLNPLPDGLWAHLTWANQTLAAPVNAQGQVDFGKVSLDKLKEAIEAGMDNFEITFETRKEASGAGG